MAASPQTGDKIDDLEGTNYKAMWNRKERRFKCNFIFTKIRQGSYN